MRIAMRSKDVDLAGAVESYIERRLHFALGRFGSRVGQVLIRIGGDGPVNAFCHLSAEVVARGRVNVEESDPDLFVAIDRATGRIGRLFGRELERARDARTGRESLRTMAA